MTTTRSTKIEQTRDDIPVVGQTGHKSGRTIQIRRLIEEYLVAHPDTEFSTNYLAKQLGIDSTSTSPLISTAYFKCEGVWQHVFRERDTTNRTNAPSYLYYYTLSKPHRVPEDRSKSKRRTKATIAKERAMAAQQLDFDRAKLKEELPKELVAEAERVIKEAKAPVMGRSGTNTAVREILRQGIKDGTIPVEEWADRLEAEEERLATEEAQEVMRSREAARRVREVREQLPPQSTYKPWARDDDPEPTPTRGVQFMQEAISNHREGKRLDLVGPRGRPLPEEHDTTHLAGVCFVCGESITEEESIAVRVKLYGGAMVTRFIHSPTEKMECWGEYAEWKNAQVQQELQRAQVRSNADIKSDDEGLLWRVQQVGSIEGKLLVKDPVSGVVYTMERWVQ